MELYDQARALWRCAQLEIFRIEDFNAPDNAEKLHSASRKL
jgi:hypothetical protein